MRVRIVKQPTSSEVEHLDLSRFQVGGVYDIGPNMAALLTVCGYAAPEMRSQQQASHPARRRDDTPGS
jgi:hypothetical protein